VPPTPRRTPLLHRVLDEPRCFGATLLDRRLALLDNRLRLGELGWQQALHLRQVPEQLRSVEDARC
jgi:hypothetical protein